MSEATFYHRETSEVESVDDMAAKADYADSEMYAGEVDAVVNGERLISPVMEDVPSAGQLTTDQRIDCVMAAVVDLHAKMDALHAVEANNTQGLQACYTMLTNLTQMLSAVQQVAHMMPGGKRIAQAMAAQANGNGGQS